MTQKRLPKPTLPETSQDDPGRGRRDYPRQAKPSQAGTQTCEQRPLHVTRLPCEQASKQASTQSKAKAMRASKSSKASKIKQSKAKQSKASTASKAGQRKAKDSNRKAWEITEAQRNTKPSNQSKRSRPLYLSSSFPLGLARRNARSD